MSDLPNDSQPISDEADTQRLRHVETAAGAVAWFVVIAAWEWATAAPKHWPGHWQGGWIGVGMLAWALYWLAYRGWPMSWVAVGGAIGTLAFTPQLRHDIDLVPLTLGFAPFAWLVAEFQRAVAQCKRIQATKAANARAVERGEAAPNLEIGADRSRLGLIHLMAWVTLVAVCLGVSGVSGRSNVLLREKVAVAGYIAVLSAPLFGLLLFMVRRLRKRPFPTQPGDFLWLAAGVESTPALLQLAGLWRLEVIGDLDAERSGGFSMVFVAPLLSGLIALVARGCMPTRRWRMLMGILAVTSCWTAFAYSFFLSRFGFHPADLIPISLFLSGFGMLAPALPLVVCLVIDWRERVRHNWTHRIGVTIRLLSYAFALVSVIGSLVVMGYFG